MLEALEAMAKENQPIPSRAMILNRKYRSLVSSWIEPLHEEADLGYEIDYVARFVLKYVHLYPSKWFMFSFIFISNSIF